MSSSNGKKRGKKSAKRPGGARKRPSKVGGMDLPKEDRFFNREWSWLDFNNRVLALAADPGVPLLERARFLSITSTNLDEFFMVRVAGLKEQFRAHSRRTGADGRTADQQLEGIARRVHEMMAVQAKVWSKDLQPAFAREGIDIITRKDYTEDDLRNLKRIFTRQIFPVLTPMAVDPAHPFPHLPNKSLSLCVMLKSRDPLRKVLYAFVEIPQLLPRFVPLKGGKGRARFALLEEVVALHLPKLFSGSQVIDSFPIRITRDSDLEIDEEEAEDLLKVIEAELRQRQWGNVVRLEVSSRITQAALAFLVDMLDVDPRDVIPVDGPLSFGDWAALAHLPNYDHLRYSLFVPQTRHDWRSSTKLFEYIADGDMLIHHPFESFGMVADFVDAAAADPQVLAIKITLYRTSPESPIVRSLIRAANNGKQVVALVELKARFDELNNIQWARLLEREGVHVVYGIVGYKTHCKACLVVRREGKQLRRYCHLATGNYNPTTAGIYTDIGLFTADSQMCEDVANLFNMLTGFSNPAEWQRIVPAPSAMHQRLIRLVRSEMALARAGKRARIICKMNSLVEPESIEALYEASQAGVKIDLIVRGICCLRPGVPGLSDNIRVSSIIGRFLEHSRIFCFWQDGDPLVYLSSADWMQRNFFSRIELMFPVDDPELKSRILDEILGCALNDTANSYDLKADGTWKKRSQRGTPEAQDSHEQLMTLAIQGATAPMEVPV